ncbi:hypothetical protein AB0M97_28860 [Streptomyces sp. NPDC051207]|uniref:hypothetical protein n=1 Tax=Streptomyces sp. NPDC051207 TaxID=3154641 RepID=UPI00344A9F39
MSGNDQPSVRREGVASRGSQVFQAGGDQFVINPPAPPPVLPHRVVVGVGVVVVLVVLAVMARFGQLEPRPDGSCRLRNRLAEEKGWHEACLTHEGEVLLLRACQDDDVFRWRFPVP